MSRLIGETRYGIYSGYRVFKDDKGIEFKVPTSFYLDDVTGWEYYGHQDTFHSSVTEGEKMYVELPKTVFILQEDYDGFNDMMIKHNKCKVNYKFN